ncbi:alpha/beta fold hydrolase [Nocardia sp. NPDC050630]|uniref:alpha/beta fold hydrolase n=1 Tax=Nocardia sp. NPDC050630 TaxID=3364321 RepID=UPI0037AD9251
MTTTPRSSNTTPGPIKQINAGVLDVGYAEYGPGAGQPVILLHVWPYDVYSYADVGSQLAADWYRVIVPFLRGYGLTTFLSAQTVRSGHQSAIARDIVDSAHRRRPPLNRSAVTESSTVLSLMQRSLAGPAATFERKDRS